MYQIDVQACVRVESFVGAEGTAWFQGKIRSCWSTSKKEKSFTQFLII